jgi:protoporphyrinogen oxidase
MKQICVLGSGMAGFGAAHKCRESGVEPIIFDKRPHFGGHTASFVYNGEFTFDEGPHVSFSKVERIQQLLAAAVDEKYEVLHTKVNNYWKGHWIKHPAQINLYGIPPDVIIEVIKDFVAAQQQREKAAPVINHYEDWLRASFGNTFAEQFPMKYTVKYHTTEARNMSTDWIGPRLYQAKLEEVLRGALVPSTPDVHYISNFRYPSHGGFASYLRKFMTSANLQLNRKLTGIDPKRKEIRFSDGSKANYDRLISSVPLPDLIPTIDGTPREVLEAASRLACTDLVIVNLVVNRRDLVDAHWSYFYDEDLFFTRLSTPHLQSPNNVPEGCGSLQAECYYSPKYRPLDRKPDDCIEPVIRDLKKAGVLREDDKILFKNTMYIEYANVIFDLERAASLAIVHGYLDDLGIRYCGRYGDWAYIWTDESFISGERAAEKALAA